MTAKKPAKKAAPKKKPAKKSPEAPCKRCGGTTRFEGGTCPDCDPGQA